MDVHTLVPNKVSVSVLKNNRYERAVDADVIVGFKEFGVAECSIRAAVEVLRSHISLPTGLNQPDAYAFRALIRQHRIACLHVSDLAVERLFWRIVVVELKERAGTQQQRPKQHKRQFFHIKHIKHIILIQVSQVF